ncbi:stalk domain-containing protein [Herbaspirillum huttiense]|uniref:stalk domain-containing protein n=1 Tax=Herbaspirillum huttiense TaxID=863372 RepID=UPI0031D8B286
MTSTRFRSRLLQKALLTTLSAAGLATALLAPLPAAAHGAAAHMLPLKKTLEDFGATVRWDAYAGLWPLQRNSVTVRVKPRATTALVNGQSVKLPVPLVMKNGQPYVSDEFINTVFAPSLDKTFQIEAVPHPLNPLSADEINATLDVLKASGRWQPGYRFTAITLAEPPKEQVWKFALGERGQTFARRADFTLPDGSQVIEGTVDLGQRSVTRWGTLQISHQPVKHPETASKRSSTPQTRSANGEGQGD